MVWACTKTGYPPTRNKNRKLELKRLEKRTRNYKYNLEDRSGKRRGTYTYILKWYKIQTKGEKESMWTTIERRYIGS